MWLLSVMMIALVLLPQVASTKKPLSLAWAISLLLGAESGETIATILDAETMLP